jgi:hypothetical protein
MQHFWKGFEKRASSRLSRELAKHLGSTPKRLTDTAIKKTPTLFSPGFRNDVDHYLQYGLAPARTLRDMGYRRHYEYFQKIRDIREKFTPPAPGSSIQQRLAKLKAGKASARAKAEKAEKVKKKSSFFEAVGVKE